MATAPKVKFKASPPSWEPPLYDFSQPQEGFPEVKEESNLENSVVFAVLLYTTHSEIDSIENYSTYLSEIRVTYDSYVERYTAVRKYADQEVASGNITGYILKGYKIKCLESNTMIVQNSSKKFQVLKKVFLNGPLKDNEFIQKKGKHYA